LYIERKLGRGWLGLTPRIGFYLLHGLRHRRMVQTLRAILAAVAMAPRSPLATMPLAGTSYLARNDRAHRGSLLHRLTQAVARIGHANGAVSATEQ
jgi:hypothetical protein